MLERILEWLPFRGAKGVKGLNATENNVQPDANVTLSILEPSEPPRLLLYFLIGSGGFILFIFIIGSVVHYYNFPIGISVPLHRLL